MGRRLAVISPDDKRSVGCPLARWSDDMCKVGEYRANGMPDDGDDVRIIMGCDVTYVTTSCADFLWSSRVIVGVVYKVKPDHQTVIKLRSKIHIVTGK
uniref:SFRICE_014975 n=1 Tax=Spodoptera frugiperda TaxID=7108 RepID=A0A2H1V8L4_SPOFR